jgi:uncharacterized membrane protein (DUF485 family)
MLRFSTDRNRADHASHEAPIFSILATTREETHMSDEHSIAGGAAQAEGADRRPEVNWSAAVRSPEFRELVRRRNAFVIPATIFFLAWFFGFILLCGYAEDFMGESIYEGFTVGYLIALSNFIMVWALGALYLREARRVFDPLARKAADAAVGPQAAGAQGPAARFSRGEDVTP